ncbi:MAG: iron transporter [Treponema sp.]|jgi:uncharacterized protein involved in high-affinity Fe2+ transport|nr:iron transporter [Treponema sp.]
MKKVLVLFLAALCAGLIITGCTPQQGEQAAETARPAEVAGAEEEAGFEEFPIGDDIELWPLNVAGVYFQPVDMLPTGTSLPAAQSDMHIEADISALENDLGYGVGDFVPYLTVRYEIAKSDDSWKIDGAFMPMSASDGPHYGTNLKLDGAGTYKVRFIIQNPESLGYLLHVDQETGVPGRFWNQPLVAEWDFDWVPRVW